MLSDTTANKVEPDTLPTDAELSEYAKITNTDENLGHQIFGRPTVSDFHYYPPSSGSYSACPQRPPHRSASSLQLAGSLRSVKRNWHLILSTTCWLYTAPANNYEHKHFSLFEVTRAL